MGIRSVLRMAMLAGSFMASTASAESSSGSISSVAYTLIPPGTPIQIEYLGDTEINNTLRHTLARELETRGYPIVSNGGLVLRFDSDIEATDTSDRNRFYTGSVAGNERSEFGLRVRPFSSGEPQLKSGTRYNLTISIGPQGGSQYWLGRANATSFGLEGGSVVRAMALALVDVFNQSIQQQTLPLE